MRILFKILAVPFVPILTVLWLVLNFLFAIAFSLLIVACIIGVLLSIIAFFGGQTQTGIFLIVISYLISPFGIPIIAGWLVKKVGDLNFALQNFIMS